MKTILSCILISVAMLSLSARLSAQNEEIQQLQNELTSASGFKRVEILLSLADACFVQGDLKNAQQYAEDASDLARRIRRSDLEAQALNREGLVYSKTGKKGLFGKDIASGKFRESNELLRKQRRPNKELLLQNLVQLRALAERNGRKDDVAEIDGEIARVQELVESLPATTAQALEKPLTREEVKEELSVISDQLLDLKKSTRNSSVQRMNYELERQKLQAQLAEQEKQINQMTEEQLKATLLVMGQRNQLDSLERKSQIDALNVDNAALALREAESKRNFYLASFVAMLFLAGGAMFSFFRARQNAKILAEKNKVIRAEQERSENLLLNILPALVAEELKKQGSTSAQYYEDVSVLFADFVGFSQIAEKLTPQQLVSELDTCFRAFDAIMAKNNLEKIKTIGDAYMAAGGLPHGGGSQLRDMINAAKEMQAWLAEWNIERARLKKPVFEARIGIHNGPVVAGVVGSKKFAFDIWGDTVNIAARIEESGEGGKINISGDVYEVVKQYFPCKYRGKIPAKNKGEIDMYFVEN